VFYKFSYFLLANLILCSKNAKIYLDFWKFFIENLNYFSNFTKLDQTFHYTRRITPKRVTSLLCPSPPHSATATQLCTCIDFEAVANLLQPCRRNDWTKVWNLDLQHTKHYAHQWGIINIKSIHSYKSLHKVYT